MITHSILNQNNPLLSPCMFNGNSSSSSSIVQNNNTNSQMNTNQNTQLSSPTNNNNNNTINLPQTSTPTISSTSAMNDLTQEEVFIKHIQEKVNFYFYFKTYL